MTEWRTTEETYSGPPRPEAPPPRPMNFWEFMDKNAETVAFTVVIIVMFVAVCISSIWGKG